jgi:DNA-binding NarL/FixJ family response regulator
MAMNRIMIVDDHILFREGLHNIIRHWDDFEVIGEASNGVEALEKAREWMPDVILMDIAMPQMNGIEATRRISMELPVIKIVILTMSEEENDLFDALKSGAHGYVLKDTPSKRLHDQLRGVMNGETPLSGMIATKILKELNLSGNHDHQPVAGLIEPLNDREQQVLELVAKGLNNPDIAEALFLSENTVKKYLHNIFEKLHLNNRVEAAIYAVRQGLVKE